MNFSNYLDIHPDVENAIKNKEPIVALESTIISHGMPYPKNVETALMVEETVRSNSCLLYTSPSPRDLSTSRMPSSA